MPEFSCCPNFINNSPGPLPPLTHVRLGLDGQHQEIELGEAEDRGLIEGHPHKGGGQHLSVHFTPSPLEYRFILELCQDHSDLEIVLQPVVHVTGGLPGPHGEQVSHQRGEAGGEAGLADEAKLELRQTDDVIPVAETPAGDVHQVGLVVILHQLDDHPHIMGVVLDGDNAHDVC